MSGRLGKPMKESQSEIIIYQNRDNNIKIDVRLEDETVWLTQKLMAELFQVKPQNITMHLKNIYQEGELDEEATCKDFLQVQIEGNRKVKRKQKFYNLDAIISAGYRIKSDIATQFRIWATQRLKEYIVKGFALDDDRFKTGRSMNYFNELQERIREIRLSERFFYQKVKKLLRGKNAVNQRQRQRIPPRLPGREKEIPPHGPGRRDAVQTETLLYPLNI